MEVMNVGEIVLAVRGEAVNCNECLLIKGVSTDSRKINMGDLFIPISGPNFDGHDFIDNAMAAGAALVFSEKDLYKEKTPYIKVKSTRNALMDLASYYRSKFNIPAVAITGSSGKTTTKEMVSAILSQSFKVLKNEGNYNNTIGLPLTIFKLNKNHEICVLEMGMNNFGEIKNLSSIVKPCMAVITNIGTAHIEYLGCRENIMKAKMEVVSFFNAKDTAILNGDDDMLANIKDNSFNIIKTGLKSENQIYASDLVQIEDKGMEFSVHIGENIQRFYIPIVGIHNVYNALCAIAVGLSMGMNIDKIKQGLSSFATASMRMEAITLDNGIKIINDAYNANPESMAAAIEVLSSIECKSRRVLVLGDMLELGIYSENEHYKIGHLAANTGIDILIAVGKRAEAMARGALDHGMLKDKVFHFADNHHAMNEIWNILLPFDAVLLKASRAVKMEEIVDFLQERR